MKNDVKDENTPALSTVLLVNDFAYINGGQSKVAIDSACLLANDGKDVIFFAACGPVAPELNHPGIKVICLMQDDILSDPKRARAALRGIWNKEAADRLRDLITGLDPETTVLHCHGYAKALSPSIGPILANSPIPCIYTMHEYFLACPNGGFFDYQRNEICTRKALGPSCLVTNCDVRHPLHKLWRVARQVATIWPGQMPRNLRDVIYISDTQLNVLQPYLSEKTRLHHVPNPIARSTVPKTNFQENDIFLFIGRLNPEKGGVLFAQAARNLGVRAVFVGDGPEAEAIRRVNPDAEITGWQSPAQVQSWLGQARALVFPSLWYEGQPLVPLEALERGVPVVCGSWVAAAEAVRHGQNGILYDRPDAAALTEALRAVDELPLASDDWNLASDGNQYLENLYRVYADAMRHENLK